MTKELWGVWRAAGGGEWSIELVDSEEEDSFGNPMGPIKVCRSFTEAKRYAIDVTQSAVRSYQSDLRSMRKLTKAAARKANE